jgi:3-methyladenine DNA glycosylase Tag
MKIESAISNARAYLKVQEEFGTFWAYAWQFTGGHPKQNWWKNVGEASELTPSRTKSQGMVRITWAVFNQIAAPEEIPPDSATKRRGWHQRA